MVEGLKGVHRGRTIAFAPGEYVDFVKIKNNIEQFSNTSMHGPSLSRNLNKYICEDKKYAYPPKGGKSTYWKLKKISDIKL